MNTTENRVELSKRAHNESGRSQEQHDDGQAGDEKDAAAELQIIKARLRFLNLIEEALLKKRTSN